MTSRFRGRFECKLDSKGRLSLPAGLRSPLSDEFTLVITNSQYQGRRCLDAYTLEEWEKLEAKIGALPPLKSEVQAFQRFYLAAGQAVEGDSQNRVLVPQSLRKYANIKGQAILVGMGEKFEIWSESEWQKIHDTLAEGFDDILNSVANLTTGDGNE